jgi:NADPH:quinone reductase
VTATVRREEARAVVGELGARVLPADAWEDEGPWDVILELVGAPNLHGNLMALATGGRILTIGIAGGAKAEMNLGLLLMKRARIHGSTLRARPLEEKAATARAVEREVLPGLEDGSLRVLVARTFPLAEAEAAYDLFAEGGKVGKIVLEA